MTGKELLSKFISFSYGNWLGIVVGLISTPVITRLLSPEEFGKASMFTLALNILMIFILFGFDQGFVRFFYEEIEENRTKLLYFSISLPALLLILVSIVILLNYRYISIFLFGEVDRNNIYILVLGLIFFVIYKFATLVIRMKQRGHIYSMLELLNKILNLVFIVFIYNAIDQSYRVIIYAMVFTYVVLAIVSVFTEIKFWNFRSINKLSLQNSYKDIFHYSYPLLLTAILTWLFQSFDKIALTKWSSFYEVGLYAAAFKIVAILNVLQVSFTTFWAPVKFERFNKNPNDVNFFSRISKLVSFVMFLVAIVTISLTDFFVLLLGFEFREAISVIPFLVFMPIMYTISETTVNGIAFFKKSKWNVVIAAVCCLLNILGNWILVPDFAAVGAAISTAASYILFFTLRTIISLKYYKVDYGLIRVVIFILFLIFYSFFQLFNISVILNYAIAGLFIIILIIFYFKDIKLTIKQGGFNSAT